MEFRRMEARDRAEMQAFYDDMGELSAMYFNHNRCNELSTMKQFDEPKPFHEYYVMTEGEKVVGQLFLWNLNLTVPTLGIAVRDGWHGKHIGTEMLRRTLADLKTRGYGGLMLTTAINNYKAQALYEKCGFVRLGIHTCKEYMYIHLFEKQ